MRILVAAVLIGGIPAPALAQYKGWHQSPVPPPPFVSRRTPTDQQFLTIYRQKLAPLRQEIVARKTAEGGTLSEPSRAEFQARLDRINEDFRSFVRERRRQSIDGSGFVQAG